MSNVLLLDWSREYRFYVEELLRNVGAKLFVVSPEYRIEFEDMENFMILPTLYDSTFIEKNSNLIVEYMRINKIDFLFNTEEELVKLEHTVRGLLGTLENISLIEKLQNKKTVRDYLLNNKIVASPSYRYFTSSEIEKNSEIFNGLSFPLFVKPTNSNFSSGVTLLENKEEFNEAISTIISETDVGSEFGILLEEAILEDDLVISVEVFVQHREIKLILFTDENQFLHIRENGLKTFYYDSIETPSKCSNSDRMKLTKSVEEIIKQFGIDNLTLHIEFKKDRFGTWNLIEINPRLCGGPIAYAHYKSTGINLVLISYKIANNLPIHKQDIIRKNRLRSLIKFFNVKVKAGVIKTINLNLTKNINKIDKLILYKEVGDIYEPLPSGMGFVMVSESENVAQSQNVNLAESIFNSLEVEIDE
ncbi:ATP-grasp domain-containing protein [Streptococcus parasanguinis]|uniref:ATP-grasp domain-containing protein n=1 Tax=Streptococcus parasanguinis TaxID=1318 RepID=UPI0039C26569